MDLRSISKNHARNSPVMNPIVSRRMPHDFQFMDLESISKKLLYMLGYSIYRKFQSAQWYSGLINE